MRNILLLIVLWCIPSIVFSSNELESFLEQVPKIEHLPSNLSSLVECEGAIEIPKEIVYGWIVQTPNDYFYLDANSVQYYAIGMAEFDTTQLLIYKVFSATSNTIQNIELFAPILPTPFSFPSTLCLYRQIQEESPTIWSMTKDGKIVVESLLCPMEVPFHTCIKYAISDQRFTVLNEDSKASDYNESKQVYNLYDKPYMAQPSEPLAKLFEMAEEYGNAFIVRGPKYVYVWSYLERILLGVIPDCDCLQLRDKTIETQSVKFRRNI